MNNDMMIMIDGQKIPVSKVKHWSFRHEDFIPNRSARESQIWSYFMGVKDAWESLDPEVFMHILSPNFTYGSYWVVNDSLNRDRYQEYIKEKFKTIRNTNSGPKIKVVVLYEGLAPEQFCYALHLQQGNNSTLLTFKFDEYGLSSLYMTDPQIFTFEPTFAKGGIVGDNGEPRVFCHECADVDKGKPMSEKQLQAFVVECVATLFKEAGSNIVGSYKSPYKEFPNIITRCENDVFYHRIDVSMPTNDGKVSNEGKEEFISAARSHNAWPMVIPVSLYCSETNGSTPLCGGSFFIKSLESRRI